MKLLLTNDDGIFAAGLAALQAAVIDLGTALVVATAECHSGAGHRVTTRAPIRVRPIDECRYAIDGTPADCVRVALDRLGPDCDWVLSGINHGGNLGADVYMSGTVAAVREGALQGKPGIAVSHYHRKGVDPLDWPRATRWLKPLLRDLVARGCPAGTFWNINLPHLPLGAPDPEVVFCPIDPSPLPVSYEALGDELRYSGDYHERRRVLGSDVDNCFRGKIAASLVSL
ncbi:MAG: 5'/3'-nucleotidase SurE [Planctomycetaceae bacterium]